MKSKTREDDSLPYKITKDPLTGKLVYIDKGNRIRLSPQEAFRVQQLEGLVESYSNLVREYFLIRRSLSDNRSERKAWQILYLLLRFVEAFGRFPNLRKSMNKKSELTNYLDQHLPKKQDPLLSQVPVQERKKFEDLLGISKRVEIPPFRHLDISRLREAGDQMRHSIHRTLSILGLKTKEGVIEYKGEQ